MSFGTILLLVLLLLLGGAAATLWGLARYPGAAHFLGIVNPATAAEAQTVMAPPVGALSAQPVPAGAGEALARVAALEARLQQLETSSAQAEGSAIRADALLVAFAARRSIERGVALGYLEPLLSQRFGPTHGRAVATVITASRRPVRLDQLVADFAALEPRLKSLPPEAGVWESIRRELGGLVTIRRADQPSQRASPTYERAAQRLSAGQVDQALAEAMRLPGIVAAPKWVADARTYIAAHRALDEIESAALLAR